MREISRVKVDTLEVGRCAKRPGIGEALRAAREFNREEEERNSRDPGGACGCWEGLDGAVAWTTGPSGERRGAVCPPAAPGEAGQQRYRLASLVVEGILPAML